MTGWDLEWKALQENFVQLTVKRFKTMEGLMDRLSTPEAKREDLEELNRNFHSLKGVGASYGFPGITALGKHSQQECRGMLDQNRLPTPEDLARLRGRLEDMKKELAAGGTGGKME